MVCPASYYNDAGHNAAIRDDEISRIFSIPTYRERLDGVTHTIIQGHRLDFHDDDIVLPVEVPDYFLFSLCDHIYLSVVRTFGADLRL